MQRCRALAAKDFGSGPSGRRAVIERFSSGGPKGCMNHFSCAMMALTAELALHLFWADGQWSEK